MNKTLNNEPTIEKLGTTVILSGEAYEHIMRSLDELKEICENLQCEIDSLKE
jgi:hypothetical protein